MRYRINHATTLEFAEPVNEHHCELRVAPRSNAEQRVISFAIATDPGATIFHYVDSFGNTVHHFSVLPPHRRLVTRVTSEVECLLENPFEFPLVEASAESAWYQQRLAREPSLYNYLLHQSSATPAARAVDWGDLVPPERDFGAPVQVSILNAMRWVSEQLAYRSGTTLTHTPLADVLKIRSGVCQDFAHLLITLVRSWGVPARYVMGYLDPGELSDEPAELQATHAWVEALIPGAGWRGFDATRQLVADQSYIRVAVGRDSEDAAPQRGTFKGADPGHSPTVALLVARQAQ